MADQPCSPTNSLSLIGTHANAHDHGQFTPALIPRVNADHMVAILNQMARVRALVIGDAISDSYVELDPDSERSNPEAPYSYIFNRKALVRRDGGGAAMRNMVFALDPLAVSVMTPYRLQAIRYGHGYIPVADLPEVSPTCLMREDRPIGPDGVAGNTASILRQLKKNGLTKEGWGKRQKSWFAERCSLSSPTLSGPPQLIILADHAQGAVHQEVLDSLRIYLAAEQRKNPMARLPVVVIDPRRHDLIDGGLEHVYSKLTQFGGAQQSEQWLYIALNYAEARGMFESRWWHPMDVGRGGATWNCLPALVCTHQSEATQIHHEPFAMSHHRARVRPPRVYSRIRDPYGCGHQFSSVFALALVAARQLRDSGHPGPSAPVAQTGPGTADVPRPVEPCLWHAVALAHLAAALQTQRIGAVPVQAEELRAEIERATEPATQTEATAEQLGDGPRDT